MTPEYILLTIVIILQLVVLVRSFSSKDPVQPHECKFEKTEIPHFCCGFKEAGSPTEIQSHVFQPLIHSEDHEILELRDGQWQHHSWRRENHPDIATYAKHPRFNVRCPDGCLMREEHKDE